MFGALLGLDSAGHVWYEAHMRPRYAWDLLALIAIGFLLLCGCTRDSGFTKGKGDIGPFILQHAISRGARPVATNSLPPVGGEWRYAEDQNGVVLQLPLEQFSEVEAFLRYTFGPPSHEPSDTTDGGKHGWYAARDIGAAVMFGYDEKRTEVIVLRPFGSNSPLPPEVFKAMAEGLEDKEEQ